MKIALTYTGSSAKHLNYLNWLKQDDDALEIITISAEKNNLEELKTCDGLVFSGGVDMHPEFYKKQAGYANQPDVFDVPRDDFEKAAFEYAQQNSLPVLGICRGLQLINCLLGGDVKQDLGDANIIHRAVVDQSKRQFDKAHAIHIKHGSMLAEINGADRGIINSAHHQAIDKLGEDLTITATSDDGIIEAIEWKDTSNKPFFLCVQWHPERMYEFQLEASALSAGIRNRFIEECSK